MCRAVVLLIFFVIFNTSAGTLNAAFIPFNDRVHLKECWDLSVDIPRWFSTYADSTRDTTGQRTLKIVPFDTVFALVNSVGWNGTDFTDAAVVRKIAAVLGARIIAGGRINRFAASKDGINGTARFQSRNDFTKTMQGTGSMPMLGGMHVYSVTVRMTVCLYDGKSGKMIDTLQLTEKDNGTALDFWIPLHQEYREADFYMMRNSEFGSKAFCSSRLGDVMKGVRSAVHNALKKYIDTTVVKPAAVQESTSPGWEAFRLLRGKILEKKGNDVYIDLGTADSVVTGERLEVMMPDNPVCSVSGDTLGWTEKVIGVIVVRAVLANRFSQSMIIEGHDLVTAGLSVRSTN